MKALRSRTMPLIASSILFASFFFATVHLGEGLKCYSCSSVLGGDCTTLTNVTSIQCTSTPSQPNSSFLSLKGGESLFKYSQQADYALSSGDVCFYGSVVGIVDGAEDSAVVRGCAPRNLLVFGCVEFEDDVTIKNVEYRTCESDNCNSSGEFQIGLISLFLPLIASLLVTR